MCSSVVVVVCMCARVLYFDATHDSPSSHPPTTYLLHCCHRIGDCPAQDGSVEKSVWDV